MKHRLPTTIILSLLASIAIATAEAASVMHEAARTGDLATVQRLLAEEVPTNRPEDGYLPLHLAAKGGHTAVIEALIAHGAVPNAPGKNDSTALHVAAIAGQANVVPVLVAAGANVEALDWKWYTPLYRAAQANQGSTVRALIAAGANPHDARRDGRWKLTAFGYTVKYGKLEALRAMLDSGVNPNAIAEAAFTGIEVAVQVDRPEPIGILFKAGARLHDPNRKQPHPLYRAAESGAVRALRALLGAGADPNFRDHRDRLAIEGAARQGQHRTAHALLKAGADTATGLHISAVLYGRNPRGRYDDVIAALLDHGALPTARATMHYKRDALPIEMLSRDAPTYIRYWLANVTLHRAALDGDAKAAQSALKHVANPNEPLKESDGSTAAHKAAGAGHAQVLAALIEAGADPELARAGDGFTPLHSAAQGGHADAVEVLHAARAAANRRANDGSTPRDLAQAGGHDEVIAWLEWMEIETAVAAGDADLVRTAIDTGMNVAMRSPADQSTLLHTAAGRNDAAMIETLVGAGADPDMPSTSGQTALHIATVAGHTDAMRTLLEAGAAVDARPANGPSALWLATNSGNEAAVALLLDHDADTESHDQKFNATALAQAAYNGAAALVQLLIAAGADVHATTGTLNSTVLHWAALGGNADITDALLATGIDVNSRDANGFTPLHFTAWKGHTNALRRMLEAGAELNARSTDDLTPLMLAARYRHSAAIEVLLDEGANADIRNDRGKVAAQLWKGQISDKGYRRLVAATGR